MQTITIKGKRVPIPWIYSKTHSLPGQGVIVSAADDEFWGNRFSAGHIICCGIPSDYQPLILAAPRLFMALNNFAADVSRGLLDSDSLDTSIDLLEELDAT